MHNEDVVGFLEKNSNKGDWEPAHTKLVRNIIDNLGIFIAGYNPNCVYQGVQLRSGGYTIGSVDIAVLANSGNLTVIEAEVMSSHSHVTSTKNKILDRLQRYSDYFWENFGIVPITIGVYRCRSSSKLHVYNSKTILPQNTDYSSLRV